jgi:katanin p60 ATPase-containing subunit A1
MVDMSYALSCQFKKAQSHYNEALESDDSETARKYAQECARLCIALAKNSPKEKQKYLGLADKWNNAITSKKQKKVISNEGSGSSERGYQEDDFTSQATELISTSHVSWDDIGGLADTIKLLKNTVVIAGIQKPKSIEPWKGILLFGPPGTGKTLLASAFAGSLDATMFNVKGEKITSKYFGESSKLLSAVYDVAREKTPSIIFMDEIDGLAVNRSGDASEASKRVLSTLLTEMDGFANKDTDIFLLTLSATNTPWNLDDAILSRFTRRIYVPLPDEKTTSAILKIHTKDVGINCNLEDIARECVRKNYSGRDISTVCQQAIHIMVNDMNPKLHELASLPFNELRKRKLKTRPLLFNDFDEAMKKIHSPVNAKTLRKDEVWNEEFGA